MATKSVTYENAMKRLEQIVSQIENNELNIDQLSTSLKEAQELITFCKGKLYETDTEIKKMLESFQEKEN